MGYSQWSVSHEELGAGLLPGRISRVSGSGGIICPAGQLLVLLLVQIPLLGEARHVLFELLHLALQGTLLGLKHVPLLNSFETTGLRVAAVLQRAPLLLQADDLLLAEATQLPVQLAHCHADQLLVREAVLQACVVAVVMVVMVVVMGLVMVASRGRGQVLPYVLLPTETLVGLVVMMVVVRVADEGLHCVLRGQVERLWVDVVLVIGNPVQVLQLRLSGAAVIVIAAAVGAAAAAAVDPAAETLVGLHPRARGAEARRGRHGGAGCADWGGGQWARRKAVAVAVGLRRFLLHLKFHQVKVVDILDGQRAVGQLCAHGEVCGHFCPCNDSCPHSQTDGRQPPRIQIAERNKSLYGVYIDTRTHPLRGAAAEPVVGGWRNFLRLLTPKTTSIFSGVNIHTHVNELAHLPARLCLLLLLTTYPRSNARFNTRSPRGRLKLEHNEFGDPSCPRFTSLLNWVLVIYCPQLNSFACLVRCVRNIVQASSFEITSCSWSPLTAVTATWPQVESFLPYQFRRCVFDSHGD